MQNRIVKSITFVPHRFQFLSSMLLNCHTYYSFRYGTHSIEELLNEAKQKGYTQLALTDINNTSACINAVRLSAELGLQISMGIDFRNGVQQQYIGLARNNEGWLALNEHLSAHLHEHKPFESRAPIFQQAYIIYPMQQYTGWALRENEYLGVEAHQLPQLNFSPAIQQRHKLVVWQTVSFADKTRFNVHRLLRAIDTNNLLSKLDATQQARGNEIMPELSLLQKQFSAWPDILTNTQNILNDCRIEFVYGKLANKNLNHYSQSIAHDIEMLRALCLEAIPYRYPQANAAVWERLNKELEVISQLNFCSYYLINYDIIRYAQHKNYYYVGRGSGSNSLVAYLLRITDVDPIELDLYFERFINLHRNNAPDFDMDFSWTDRDDITRYIFERFGKQRTALLGAYNTFQHDAIIRELGKVFGLPPNEIDRLQQTRTQGAKDDIEKLILQYSAIIHGYPSHLSIHSSGILISEKPIHSYSATFMPPKGYGTTQFSMLEAEDIGLYKFDILSQRGLGKIKDTIQMVEKNKSVSIDIHDTARFKTDPVVKNLLRSGQTIGCFYIESPAMRGLLTKLQADDYLRLVAASSIIRPGVSKSGMMREYILRFRNEHLRQKARVALPEFYDLLEETYGVMVYQEDVIKVAHYFAGLTLAESDYLRRGMSWKFKQRNEFSRVKDNFFHNCLQKGHSLEQIESIWLQIESFANYAFSKGHSASYAVESYQALFLKAYYPLEYMAATLNNGGGFYSRELYVHEARLHGAILHHPCVNRGSFYCHLDKKNLYIGLGMIFGIEQETIIAICKERERQGAFSSLYDFTKRVRISIEQIRYLIRANAFGFTGRHKKELLWEVHSLLQPNKQSNQFAVLFDTQISSWKLPTLQHSAIEEAYDEIELFGFPFCSPFELLQTPVENTLQAKDLRHYIGQSVCVYAYLITTKFVRTTKGETMYFGTFLDIAGQWLDTVHFPESVKQYPFVGKGVYELHGRVTEEYDFLSIDIQKMHRLAYVDRENLRYPVETIEATLTHAL